ncbi:MAG: FHA domain-containing protein [Kiritimatiellae bacterium]|nr:FHA domain-containing protein [Kiritimatiellia bacterium]
MTVLTITSGELKGQKIDIDRDEITIGRSDQNHISLNEPAVSAKHCVVIRDGKKYTIKDLHSTNGTRLNGRNISESRLKPNDVIMVGTIEITIDGQDMEVEPEKEQFTRANTTPTVIIAPIRNGAGGAPPSPVFQTKRDNRPIVIAFIVLCLLLVAAAMVWFLRAVFTK